jgi:hypothetical protein
MKNAARLIPACILSLLLILLAACQQPAPPNYDAEIDASVEVWNTGNVDALDGLLASNHVRRSTPNSTTGAEVVGIEAMKEAVLAAREVTDNFTVEIDERVYTADRVTLRWTLSGTNVATGKPWSVPGLSLIHMLDRKPIAEYAYFDVLDLYQQVGFTLTPPPAEE